MTISASLTLLATLRISVRQLPKSAGPQRATALANPPIQSSAVQEVRNRASTQTFAWQRPMDMIRVQTAAKILAKPFVTLSLLP